MSHHHHHHRHHKRQQNLAWLGLVLVVVVLAFCGLAIWSDNSHKQEPVNPPAPVVVDQPPTIEVSPPTEPPVPPTTAPVDQPKQHVARPKHHHRHHRHPVAPSCDLPMIPGYDSDGMVIGIPNPNCNN